MLGSSGLKANEYGPYIGFSTRRLCVKDPDLRIVKSVREVMARQ